MTEYKSKHGQVKRSQSELYMAFTDLRNFLAFLPEDKRGDITADFDSMRGKFQGIEIGVRVTRREPYSYIEMQDDGAPFKFTLMLHFDVVPGEPGMTDFYIVAVPELNVLTRMLIGNKLQEALDKIVDGLVDVSSGKMPEGMPDELKDKLKF